MTQYMASTDIITVLFTGDGGRISATFTWWNVAVAAAFILINVFMSMSLRLKLEGPLLISSIRCVIQLTLMGLILQDVFRAQNPYYVAFMTAVLILLSTYETVYDKSDRTWHGMFMTVLVNTAFSTLLIGIIGTRWAMEEKNFWVPEIFIPTIGLLLGITTGSMAVSLDNCLTELTENQGRIETYLAYGATRFEASRSIAIDAVRLAMLPTINRMSIVGLITIPGTMSGQILNNVPIMNAVRYQIVISFMISASSGIAVLGVVAMCMHAIVDGKHRLRAERVNKVHIPILYDIKRLIIGVWKKATRTLCGCCKRSLKSADDERRPLLSSNRVDED
ncbi:hypothetical protein BDB00DRAFT_833180 [Zychaea mexicana]|uniref:uncharacterized protein n=1 Tax=Zychaea mexicana TaxID=64656 RepID=UPI0022FEAD12|nr:uncharacterized protein BDB00DRAFT_833180 [Zychaea mexicana]KAI9491336.1 hypothetical protein BDB00DRAFT_833180 [Zychaea mexicana]